MIQESNPHPFHLEYIESDISHPVLWESHCHAQYEMIAVDDGDITVMLEDKNYRLQKNQIILIPPLCYHSVTANEKGRYRRITALFGAEAIPAVLQGDFAARRRDALIAGFPVDRLKNICREKRKAYFLPLLNSLMIQIFYEALQTAHPLPDAESDAFLQSALAYIDQHLHEKILLDALARHTARSKSSFCHLFEEKMNTSPKQYILQKKLALASKMMNEGTPPTVAALRIGYENYSNFYRIYLKYFGHPPAGKRP